MSDLIAESDYNGNRVINVRAISGDVVALNDKVAEVVVDTDDGKQRCIAVKQFGGGGGGGTSDYDELENRPKINSTTLTGNKSSSDLGLQDELVSGTNIKTINNTTLLGSGNIDTPTTDVQIDGVSIVSSDVANLTATNLASPVRGVRPAYTEITASSATYTLNSNATYGQAPSQAVTYTLPTVVAGVDNWTKVFVNCTTTTSISFVTSDSSTITPVGSPTLVSGHTYIFVCQYDNLASTWKVFVVDSTVS